MKAHTYWILVFLSLPYVVSSKEPTPDRLISSFGCKLDEYTYVYKSFYCYIFDVVSANQYTLTGACLSNSIIPIKKRYSSITKFFQQFYNDSSYYSNAYLPFYNYLCLGILDDWPNAYQNCEWHSLTCPHESDCDSIPITITLNNIKILSLDFEIDSLILHASTNQKTKIAQKSKGYVQLFKISGVFIETSVEHLGTIAHGPHFIDEKHNNMYRYNELIKRNKICYIPFQVDIEKVH